MDVLVLFLALLSLFGKHTAQQSALTDPDEVAALKKLIDYWNLETKLNFMGIDPCASNATWAQDGANPLVACDCSSNICHVTKLKIYALDISGEIPNQLFLLKKLKDLNLGQNVLTGPIPSAIGQLSDMEYLSLGINNLSGEVPKELGNLTKLRSLSFGSNSFIGSLPPDLGNLTSLQQLYIDSSGVSGPIPHELSNLKSLQILWASDNLFTGKLPEFLGTFKDLNVLRLEGTMLEGPIPNSYGALTQLDDLRIGDLGGEDSSLDFLENLTKLTILSLRNNRISGQIPAKLGTFSNLRSLDLSFNKLTGSIPNSFQNLALLEYLYLGSNNLSGELPRHIGYSNTLALFQIQKSPPSLVLSVYSTYNSVVISILRDVSFNPLSGSMPSHINTWNSIGTSIVSGKEVQLMSCISDNTKCSNIKNPSTSFSIKCGGREMETLDGNKFEDDSDTLGAASMNVGRDHEWAVSNTGAFLSNPHGSKYTTETSSQITQTLDSELYKSARVSSSSLRYYGLGMKNGAYRIELHFAEIQMDEDPNSWKGLGRRLFDIYIQGERVAKDFNVKKEAGGSKRALVKVLEANVTNTIMDIHFMWAGRGTCCIPFQSTYGPLVSAIHVSQVFGQESSSSSNNDNGRTGKIVGLTLGSFGALIIIVSMVYIWWRKMARSPLHSRIQSDSPTKASMQVS